MKIYMVMGVKENIDVEFYTKTQSLKLEWANGMIGAIPVFDNVDDAIDYAGNHGGLEIIPVQDKNVMGNLNIIPFKKGKQ